MVKYVGLIVRDLRALKAWEDEYIYFDLSSKNIKDAMSELEQKVDVTTTMGAIFLKSSGVIKLNSCHTYNLYNRVWVFRDDGWCLADEDHNEFSNIVIERHMCKGQLVSYQRLY